MLKVLAHSWPLLLGVTMLMMGNGIQSSLLGIRGRIEGFSTPELSYVMAGYFAGFLLGSYATPALIRRVGHIRVFSALGSLISAVLVVYPVWPEWGAWVALRVLVGFCFSGIYITTESWLNNTASNETRGQALSAYMIVQMLGIVAAQGLLNLAPPASFILFVVASVLVSLAFLPVLLTPSPAPTFAETKPLPFRALFRLSPLGCAGMLLTGGIYSTMSGMSAVWGATIGLSVPQISLFVGVMYLGGMALQYPLGWLSDRMDRRRLIFILSALGAVALLIPSFLPVPYAGYLIAAVVLGGLTNPLYALLIAHTNDHLHRDQMAGASAGMIFLNGLGAIGGPIVTGFFMENLGPGGFFFVSALLFAVLAAYTAWRMARRRQDERGGFAPLAPSASALAVDTVLDEAARKGSPS